MEPAQKRAACDFLYQHWLRGTRVDALPQPFLPRDRAEAYEVQACIEAYTKVPLYGWKIAATSVAGQKHIGVDGPLAGRILAERVIENGGSCALGTNLMKVAEMEFAFRMARDLPPRAEHYSQEEVLSHVGSLHPAIEIPDSRYNHFESVGLASLVADNACAHRFLLGEAVADWRGLDLAKHQVRAYRNGALAEEGVGSNVLGDPRFALTWLVNELSRHGVTLKAGEVVTTGTCVKPVVIEANQRIEGDFGSCGRVAIEITP
ncbi:MAG TPA: fumarylacetoacetate hydrolase family protein [Rhizomicrobium sp.]|nr:fumarylacetoacetate hydrolase family protein [Rhizomicrobium sp.]